MTCGYDAEQQLLPLAFTVITSEESVTNWGWFMQWLRKEIVGPDKITVISDQHLGIRAVFERPDFGWHTTPQKGFYSGYFPQLAAVVQPLLLGVLQSLTAVLLKTAANYL
jgi:hypothetical protein